MARRKGPSLAKKQSSSRKPSLDKSREIDLGKKSEPDNEEQERFTGPTLTYEGDDVTVTASPLGSIEARVDLIENDNLEVELVVGIDVSPIDLGLDYDVETGELNASGGIGIPGDLLGVSGGLTIDTDTGEIVSISAGVELGGLSVELEQSLDGCRTTLTTTYFGVGISTRVDNCENKKEEEEKKEEDNDSGGMSITAMEGQIDGLTGVVGCHNFIGIGPTPGLFFDCNANITNTSDYGNPTQYMMGPGNVLGDNGSLADKVAAGWALLSGGAKNLAKFYINENLIYDAINPWSITNHEWDNYPTRPVSYQAIGKIYTYAHSLTGGGYTRSVVIRFDGAKVEDIKEAFRRAISTVLFTTGLKNYYSFDNPKNWGSIFSSPWVEEPNRVVGFDNSINSLGSACGCDFHPPIEEEPQPRRSPPPPPPPRENDMNNECCRALTSLVRKISNVTGLLENPGYPLPVIAQDEEGNPITINTTNLLAFLALQSNSEVLKILKEIGHVTGRSEENQYPGSLPGSMLGEGGGDREINNINDFLLYLHDTNDERWGQWEIDIQVENKEGERQPIKLNNLAEANAEIYGLLLQLLVNSQSNQTFNVKNLIETGLVRKEVVQSKRDLKVLLDALGFDYEESIENLNLTFSIETKDKKIETEEDLLEESNVAIPTRQFNDSTSLKEILGELKQAAAIIRAVHWRKLDPKKDMGKQVLEYLDLGLSIADKLPGLKDKFTAQQNGEEEGGDRWDAWLEKIENEWVTELGREDEDRKDRPRIREVGRDLSD